MYLAPENLQQHPKSPDGATAGTDPVAAGTAPTILQPIAGTSSSNNKDAAGAEAATTQSQSVTATQTPTNAITIIPPSGTLVPSGFMFVETTYEPRQNVTPDEVAGLSDNDLLTGLKKQRNRTQDELDAFVLFFDEAVVRFSDEQPRAASGQFQRSDKPTLPEAFAAIGLNYETERKRKQRYLAAMRVRFAMQKPLQLSEGDTVKPKDGAGDTEYMVVNVHKSAPKVDVVPKGSASGNAVTFATESLKRVKPTIKKVKVGDLILCEDKGAEYTYEGNGKFTRTKTPTALEQKRERELASIKAKKEREIAKLEEKKRQQELRKAEAARRDLEKIAEKERRKTEADAKKEAARLRKAAAAAEKANKRSKANTIAPPRTSTTKRTTPKPLQIAPIPQKPPDYVLLQPGKKYTVRPHPQGGSGVYEVNSTFCWQKHPTQDSAWNAIEAVNARAMQPSNATSAVTHG